MSEPLPRRIAVVGCSGAGKTTFARRLSERLGIPHVEIDSLYHGPDWTPAPREVLRERVSEVLSRETWILDGNYRSSLGDLVRASADTVAWLDPSRLVVMRSVIRRSLARGWSGTELWNGNRERLLNLLDPRPDRNIVLWAWTQFPKYRASYEAESRDAPGVARWHRFRTREEAEAWIESLPARPSSAHPVA